MTRPARRAPKDYARLDSQGMQDMSAIDNKCNGFQSEDDNNIRMNGSSAKKRLHRKQRRIAENFHTPTNINPNHRQGKSKSILEIKKAYCDIGDMQL